MILSMDWTTYFQQITPAWMPWMLMLAGVFAALFSFFSVTITLLMPALAYTGTGVYVYPIGPIIVGVIVSILLIWLTFWLFRKAVRLFKKRKRENQEQHVQPLNQ